MTADKILCLVIGFILGINATFIFIGMMIANGRDEDDK